MKSALIMIPKRPLLAAFCAVTALMLCRVAHADLVDPAVASYSAALDFLGRYAANTVNGSGMSGPGNAGDTHDNNSPDMWMSGGVYVGPDHNPYIAYDLGSPYTLQITRIWQYNEVSFTQVSAKTVLISVSADNVTYTPLSTNVLNQATGTAFEPNQDIATVANNVRYVKIQILDTWDGAVFWNGGAGPNGTDGRFLTGFSEVRFEVVGPVVLIPLITTQPQGQTNYTGSSVSFTVQATDNGVPPLSYQWKKNGTNLTDIGNISGSSTTNLTVSNLSTNDSGNYNVIVSNPTGPSPSTIVPLVVLQSPLTTININTYAGVSFTGIPGYHYQVQYNDSLNPNNWQVLQEIASLPAAPSPYTVYDTTPITNSQRFYRVVFIP
jgi:hypothetical protein